jgi:2-dehydropantoate 2-reductase
VKIVILGAGAVGSIIGAHLAREGEDVVFIARGERGKFIREHGIKVTGLADFTVPVNVTDNLNEVEQADVLLVAVKTYDMEEALKSVSHLEVGSVLSVQNGVFKNEQLAQYFGQEKTLGAATTIGGEVMQAGEVRFTMKGVLWLGELPEGTSERVQAFAAILAAAGINVEVSPKIQSVEWSKYVVFMSIMPVAVLTRFELYKMLRDSDIARAIAMLARETAQLSAKLGIPLDDYGAVFAKSLSSGPIEESVARLNQFGKMLESQGGTAVRVSTLQDLERGRRLEVEEILGYALEKGRELDVQLPTVEISYRLLTEINRYLQ